MSKLDALLERKRHAYDDAGFDPVFMPDELFDFQRSLVEWSVRKGRAAIFADCGLGKSAMQMTFAQNVVEKTNGRVLVLTPLAVAPQMVEEAAKFGIEAARSNDGKPIGKITVTNYEKLHHFDPADFVGVVCDESSILKHFTGATQKAVTRFVSKLNYRLLCTATAAPNDYIELGTSSEALGYLSHSEMLTRFFRQLDDKGQKKEAKLQEMAEKVGREAPSYYRKLAFRVSQTIGQWRLKHHAQQDFWRWVASWAKAVRKPSDLGFSDDRFILPALNERHHIVTAETPPEGWLFTTTAFGLSEEREERKRTINERCGLAAELVSHNKPAVIWCHTNAEGDLLESMIPDARQIAGRTPDDEKEQIYQAFSSGQCRVLVIKPKIGAWGMNWQHCAHVVSFASHSYEQYYQSVRRCWRFGQKLPVTVDVIATEGEQRVMQNMQRKSDQAAAMFEILVNSMSNALSIKPKTTHNTPTIKPSWL